MKPKISIVDYGLCNLYNVSNAFEHIGADVKIISSPEEANKAERIVLPGVGAFKNGMRGLNLRNLIDPLKEHAHKKLPFLGICLGMQMMFDISYEFGEIEGLNLISGKVEKIPDHGTNKEKHKYIHIMSLHLKIHCDTLNSTFIRCDILLFSTVLHISPHPAATCPHERL